jgi:hypothetical protein
MPDPKSTSPDLPDLTWPLLLGQFVTLAQASISFPKTDEGDRWRLSVPSIIHLQAAAMALSQLDRLPKIDRASACDKAAHLIAHHTTTLQQLWPESVPASLSEVITDAHDSLTTTRNAINSGTLSRDTGEGRVQSAHSTE